mmetsp:Transcript_35121/g.87211  ORF Transcript_35121/g.87211 Transcript_35121/m.87211 type:complete len:222 (+) Transcript_35121:48-713(+)
MTFRPTWTSQFWVRRGTCPPPPPFLRTSPSAAQWTRTRWCSTSTAPTTPCAPGGTAIKCSCACFSHTKGRAPSGPSQATHAHQQPPPPASPWPSGSAAARRHRLPRPCSRVWMRPSRATRLMSWCSRATGSGMWGVAVGVRVRRCGLRMQRCTGRLSSLWLTVRGMVKGWGTECCWRWMCCSSMKADRQTDRPARLRGVWRVECLMQCMACTREASWGVFV